MKSLVRIRIQMRPGVEGAAAISGQRTIDVPTVGAPQEAATRAGERVRNAVQELLEDYQAEAGLTEKPDAA